MPAVLAIRMVAVVPGLAPRRKATHKHQRLRRSSRRSGAARRPGRGGASRLDVPRCGIPASGRRVIAFPREIAPELRWHVERFVKPGSDSLVFFGPKGGRLRRSNFRNIWIKARDEAGLAGLHLHDLRHTGNTMAAGTGASLRELMERVGHSSTRAALIY